MYFDWPTYFQLWRLSLFGQRRVARSQRRSLVFCVGFLLGLPLVEAVNKLFWLLDHLFCRGFRKMPLSQPIFVIGNPRSGTTILHRVLARDTEQFFCFRSWELMFPSALQKRLLAGLGRVDRLFGSPFRKGIERSEARRFERLNRMHQVGLFQPEEDDKILMHILASPDLTFLFPFADFERLGRLDLMTDEPRKQRTMQFYRQCIQRQAYFTGGNRTFLSKSPWSTGRIETLNEHFPDCRIIYMVRNPLDVVASIISLARALVEEAFGVHPGPELDERVYDGIKFFYRYPLERLDEFPPHRCLIVNYDRLLREPKETFLEIYERFGLELSPEAEARLDAEVAAMKQHKSRHKYSLDHCAIAPERIVSDLGYVFDRFGFDRRGIVPCDDDPATPSAELVEVEGRLSP